MPHVRLVRPIPYAVCKEHAAKQSARRSRQSRVQSPVCIYHDFTVYECVYVCVCAFKCIAVSSAVNKSRILQSFTLGPAW